MKTVKNLCATVIILFTLSSCSKGIPTDFDYGKFEDNRYSNSFFDFSMELPAGWNIQSSKEMQALSDLGTDMVAGNDEAFKKQLEISQIRVANLFTAFQFEIEEATAYNPSVLINAENVSAAPIKDAKDYLNASRQALARSQVKISPTSSNETIDLGGKEFYFFDADIDLQGLIVHQRYYSRIINGFSLNIVLNYQTEAEKELLLDILKTIKLN